MSTMSLIKNEFTDKSEGSRQTLAIFPECIARAYLTGLSSFGLAVCGAHFTQKLLFKNKLPFKVHFALTVSVAVGVAYKVSLDKVQICQAVKAEEEKRYYFTKLNEDENKF